MMTGGHSRKFAKQAGITFQWLYQLLGKGREPPVVTKCGELRAYKKGARRCRKMVPRLEGALWICRRYGGANCEVPS